MCIYCPHQCRWSVRFSLWHSRLVSANCSIPSNLPALPLRGWFSDFQLSVSLLLPPSLSPSLSPSHPKLLGRAVASPPAGSSPLWSLITSSCPSGHLLTVYSECSLLSSSTQCPGPQLSRAAAPWALSPSLEGCWPCHGAGGASMGEGSSHFHGDLWR